jgi:hypothetical protein
VTFEIIVTFVVEKLARGLTRPQREREEKWPN